MKKLLLCLSTAILIFILAASCVKGDGNAPPVNIYTFSDKKRVITSATVSELDFYNMNIYALSFSTNYLTISHNKSPNYFMVFFSDNIIGKEINLIDLPVFDDDYIISISTVENGNSYNYSGIQTNGIVQYTATYSVDSNDSSPAWMERKYVFSGSFKIIKHGDIFKVDISVEIDRKTSGCSYSGTPINISESAKVFPAGFPIIKD